MNAKPALVDTSWLADRLGRPEIAVIDASWAFPVERRDLDAEFATHHIPGSVRFDIDLVSDRTTDLPHMLPSPDAFATAVGALGIGDDSMVVVYDSAGLMSAARVWWSFRVFGHDAVAVLDGGLPKWRAEGRLIATGPATPVAKQFTARFRPGLVRHRDQILANIARSDEQLIDARSAGRFAGTEPEPRAGLRGGHVPGSFSLPFTDLLDPATKTVRSPDAIAARFKAAGVDLSRPVVASCGSGITACVLALGAHLAGRTDVAVYDGSWTEWALRPELPVESGTR